MEVCALCMRDVMLVIWCVFVCAKYAPRVCVCANKVKEGMRVWKIPPKGEKNIYGDVHNYSVKIQVLEFVYVFV